MASNRTRGKMRRPIKLSPRIFLLLYTVLSLLLVSGCSETSSSSKTVVGRTSKVTVQSEVDDKEEVQSFDINNCSGKADIKRTEQRSQTIDVITSAEVAASAGIPRPGQAGASRRAVASMLVRSDH